MRKTTATVIAAWPTACECCMTVIARGQRFVIGRRNSHWCVSCWEERHA